MKPGIAPDIRRFQRQIGGTTFCRYRKIVLK